MEVILFFLLSIVTFTLLFKVVYAIGVNEGRKIKAEELEAHIRDAILRPEPNSKFRYFQ